MKTTTLALASLILMLAGCKLLMFGGAFILPDTKKVAPEFDKLANKRVLVMVWAEPETLYAYRYVRLELGTYIGDQIRAGVEGVDLVNARLVEDFIDRDPDAAMSPRLVGKHFGVEQVVYLELLEFQMRHPESPDLVQGHIRATVRVEDVVADADEPQSYELQEVEAVYPTQPRLFNPSVAEMIRSETYIKFAELVARKFHEHKEKI